MSKDEARKQERAAEAERRRKLWGEFTPRVVPVAVAAALSSGRGELAKIAANQIVEGTLVLDAQQQADLVLLIGEFIEHDRAIRADLDHIHEEAEDVQRSIHGALGRLTRAVDPTATPDEDDEF